MTDNFERGRQRAITILSQRTERPGTMSVAEWLDHPRNAPLHTEHPEAILGYKLVRQAVAGTLADVGEVLREIATYQGEPWGAAPRPPDDWFAGSVLGQPG